MDAKYCVSWLGLKSENTSCEDSLDFVILYSNRWLKIEATAHGNKAQYGVRLERAPKLRRDLNTSQEYADRSSSYGGVRIGPVYLPQQPQPPKQPHPSKDPSTPPPNTSTQKPNPHGRTWSSTLHRHFCNISTGTKPAHISAELASEEPRLGHFSEA